MQRIGDFKSWDHGQPLIAAGVFVGRERQLKKKTMVRTLWGFEKREKALAGADGQPPGEDAITP